MEGMQEPAGVLDMVPPALLTRRAGLEDFARGEFSDALAHFDEYLSFESRDREILNYKARALERLGRLNDSLNCVDQCLELAPQDADELCNRALILTKLSRREDALAAFDQTLALYPGHTEVWVKRAFLLHQLGRRDDALASADRAVQCDERNFNALNTRGMILDDLGRRDEALADFAAILSRDPNHADAITNRGILHARVGEFREALACYDRSLSINSGQPNAFYNRAVIRLVLGDWSRGFREFEQRWQIFPHEAARLTRLAPRWLGDSDIQGKTILLHHEQGFGDTLQFSRYVPLVARRGAHVIVAVPAGLRRLMETLPGNPRIVSEGEAIPAHDFHCPLMSLPLAFGTTPDSVPTTVPYLRADPARVKFWAKRLGPRRRPRIGLVWSGRRYPPINHARDMTFDLIRPLLTLNADFVCLHTELSEAERASVACQSNIEWVGETLGDFADTAGLVLNLDLVMTVDSAVAHLAGALGKPVWVMNRYASCWRWLLDRHDSPWYPSLRLFRQHALGDWVGVVEDVRQAAVKLLGHQTRSAVGSEPGPVGVATAGAGTRLLQEGLDRHTQGAFAEAIAAYRCVLSKSPNHSDALHYLAIALAQLGRHEEALEPFTRAIALQPANAAVHTHYGNALAGLRRHHDALVCYDRAIACDPTFTEAHYNKGVALAAMDRSDAALIAYERAIELNPAHAQAHNNLGNALADQGRWDDAFGAYERAISASPGFVDALVNRSHGLRRRHMYDAALKDADEAVARDASRAECHNSRGAALADMGRHADALDSYDRAITLDPSSAEPVWNKGLIELASGQLREGFGHYESRWRVKSLALTERFADRSRLRPEDSIVGKVVLLHAEQGYGDTLQFCRYATLMAARDARVVLSVPSALQPLLATLPGIEVVAQGSEGSFDFHCPLLSVPRMLGTELATVPASVPYLTCDAAQMSRWAARLLQHASQQTVPKIGLVWSGRRTHHNDQNRSIPLEKLLPITAVPAQWISLQKEVRDSDDGCLSGTPAIARWGEQLTDFADAAALIAHLDLVITVDTAVAHLAGALAKPVWILLPYVADWRWLRDRSDSPWYPTARLFRQTEPRSWTSVIDNVSQELQVFLHAGAKRAPPTKRLRAKK